MRLLLVRHGESEWNAGGRLQGQADPPLSALGRAQAAHMAGRLVDEEVDVIVTSDLERAVDTALALADAKRMPVLRRADLREVDLGSWTGVLREEIEASDPESWRRWRMEGIEGWDGGERYADALGRVADAIGAIAAEWEGKTVVAVTHGGCIRLATCHLLDLPAESLGRFMSIGNTSITEFLVEPDGRGRIVRLNDLAHLLAPTAVDDLEAPG